jgi:hypothetical protein
MGFPKKRTLEAGIQTSNFFNLPGFCVPLKVLLVVLLVLHYVKIVNENFTKCD